MGINTLFPRHIVIGRQLNSGRIGMRNWRLLLVYLLLSPAAFAAKAQEIRDTLQSARIVSDRITQDTGTRIVTPQELKTIVSATGDTDVIKYVQTLPGVSTGAEGSSAIYVRGGNIGSNQITLDGVPLYGGTHLLGLSGVYPSDIISEAAFRIGGFHGDESNISASHIDLKTVDGSFTTPGHNIFASNFFVGGTVSTPLVQNKLSLVGALRISPLGPEFRAIQSIAGGSLDSLSRPHAIVYDCFTKIKWLINSGNSLSFSIFGSHDAYSYRYGGSSDESLGWSNFIANIRHNGRMGGGWSVEDGLSFDLFHGRQGVVRDMSGTLNNIAIESSLNEITAEAVISRPLSRAGDVRIGIRERFAWFNPGTSSTFKGGGPWRPLDSPRTDNTSHTSITTLHGQWDLTVWERISLMVSGRLNIHAADEAEDPSWKWRIDPEVGLHIKTNITTWLAAEATADWTAQYYHTLEGIPLGWSMDLLVPTSSSRPPEKARQFYAGLLTSFGKHHITVGAYEKHMSNLVLFSDASMLFSSVIAGWSHNIKIGAGTSKGIELLYEKTGQRLDWRIAYTLSRTDRTFEEVNNGVSFPAKFDRRHILSATASLLITNGERLNISLTGHFTLQSGHWETVASGEYPAITLFGQPFTLNYFTSVNNYEMPTYIRMDLGIHFKFKTPHPQELNLGIYNAMNRHNPFSIIYDDRSREWRQISLFPLMPSVNYRISF